MPVKEYSPEELQGDSIASVDNQSAEQPGFFASLGETVGLGPRSMRAAVAERQAHPIGSLVEASMGPAYQIGKGLYGGFMRSTGEFGKGVDDLRQQGNWPSLAGHAINAIPFIGPAMERLNEQVPASTPGESYLGQIGDVLTNPGAMGTITGTAIQTAPLVTSGPMSAVLRRPAAAMTEGLQRGGGALLNRTVGATARDFSRGANPGRAYLAGGGRPAWTMRGLAQQAIGEPEAPQLGGLTGRAGQKLGSLYSEATESGMRFPEPAVREELESPLSEYEAGLEGPGGTGAGSMIGEYRARLTPSTNPFSIGSEGYTPRGLFDLKRSIAGQARWNPLEPAGLNAVRQEQVGRLGGMLTEQIPEAAPLNKIYQGGLRFGNRAVQRAATGSAPLTQIGRRAFESGLGGVGYMAGHPVAGALPLLADTIPVKTAAGWGLYRVGTGLERPVSPWLTPLPALFGANARNQTEKEPQ